MITALMLFLGFIVGCSLFVMYFATTIFIAIFAALWMLAAIIATCTVCIITELKNIDPKNDW